MSSLLTCAPRSSGGKCFSGGCMRESRGGRGGLIQQIGLGSPPPPKKILDLCMQVCDLYMKRKECLLSIDRCPLVFWRFMFEWFGVWELTYTDGVLGAGAGSRLIGGALTLGTLWKIHQSLCCSYHYNRLQFSLKKYELGIRSCAFNSLTKPTQNHIIEYNHKSLQILYINIHLNFFFLSFLLKKKEWFN